MKPGTAHLLRCTTNVSGRALALARVARRPAIAAAALAALLGTSAAAAQEVASPAPRPVIVLAAPQVDGTDVDDRAVAVVTAHLRALDLDVRVVRPNAAAWDLAGVRDGARKLIDAASARGALWLDAAHEEDFGLYALERDGDELYGRRVVAARGKTATALESLAGIAAAVGEELAQGHATGLPKVDVAPSGDAPEARTRGPEAETTTPAAQEKDLNDATDTPPKVVVSRPMITADTATSDARPPLSRGPTPWPMLAFSASYVGGTFGGSQPWQNGASLRASFAPVPGLYLGAGYDVMAPSKALLEHGTSELTRHPMFAGGGYRIAAGSRFDLQFGARATFDVAQHDLSLEGHGQHGPGSQGPGAGPGPLEDRGRTMTGLLVSAAPVAEAFFLISDQLRMNAMIGVDFPIAYSAVSGAPAGASQGPPPGLAWDPIRFIAGVGFEYGVVVPSGRKPAMTASR